MPPRWQHNRILSLTCLDMPVASGRLLLFFGLPLLQDGVSMVRLSHSGFCPVPPITSTKRRVFAFLTSMELMPPPTVFRLLIPGLPGLLLLRSPASSMSLIQWAQFTVIALCDLSAALGMDPSILLATPSAHGSWTAHSPDFSPPARFLSSLLFWFLFFCQIFKGRISSDFFSLYMLSLGNLFGSHGFKYNLCATGYKFNCITAHLGHQRRWDAPRSYILLRKTEHCQLRDVTAPYVLTVRQIPFSEESECEKETPKN